MLSRSSMFIGTLLVALLAAVPAAHAYKETTATISASDCVGCHGTSTVNIGDNDAGRQGPHGTYSTASQKCKVCHSVHAATGGGFKLLPAATIKATCEVCHDGTGGQGVYGVLAARGVTKVADHSIDTTNVVPGGNAATGGSATATFLGQSGRLTCSDCHSPHGARVVASFTGDRRRLTTDTAGYSSNSLLKQRPTSSTTTVTVYGSDWCGTCHKGRLSGGAVHNHPVDSLAITTTPFYYENVARVTGTGQFTTNLGTLGQNNFGYVMPFPRTAQQSGHRPICQQCHEDVRNVGDTTYGTIVAGEVYNGASTDGTPTTGNPRFQVFPHESQNPYFLLETEDDLCTNCHDPNMQLP